MWQEINIFLRDSAAFYGFISLFCGFAACPGLAGRWFTVEPDPVVFTLFSNRQLSPLGRPGLEFRRDRWELADFPTLAKRRPGGSNCLGRANPHEPPLSLAAIDDREVDFAAPTKK
jgi:hypothetical protein